MSKAIALNVTSAINFYKLYTANIESDEKLLSDRQKRKRWLTGMYVYYRYLEASEKAVKDFNKILQKKSDLDQPAVQNWITRYKQLAKEELFDFENFDFSNIPNSKLSLPVLKLHVNGMDSIPILQFRKLHNILYQRSHKSGTHQNWEVDTNAASDLLRVMHLLSADFPLQ